MSKSVEELFKDAPNGATHYNPVNQMFYRFCGGLGEVFHFSFMDWQDASALHEYGSLMIERPQTKPWSGPEDGLPPVGTVCELRTKRGGWGEAEIKYQGRRGICVWLWVRRDGNSEQVEWAESPDKLEFRAIRTPEQIAAEKRETAIRELMEIAQVDCRVTAARLVDAGFKR